MESIKDLIGKTLINIQNDDGYDLYFTCSDGTKYKLYHEQSCCEYVVIGDINGDLNDLIGTPILLADEVSNPISSDTGFPKYSNFYKEPYESYTWTFYRFATIKGYVNIKCFGGGTGEYSEKVDFKRIYND